MCMGKFYQLAFLGTDGLSVNMNIFFNCNRIHFQSNPANSTSTRETLESGKV